MNQIKKRIQKRRWGSSKSGRVKEIKARKKNNGRIRVGVQKGSKKK